MAIGYELLVNGYRLFVNGSLEQKAGSSKLKAQHRRCAQEDCQPGLESWLAGAQGGRMATLLVKMSRERAGRNEAARLATREKLRAALAELLPAGSAIWVFGSLLRPGRFAEESDVDLAVETLPAGLSEFALQGELENRLERRVDILILGETRLRHSIEREGERWTL